MIYNIQPFNSLGELKLGSTLQDVVAILGLDYISIELTPYPGSQSYFNRHSIKIIFDKMQRAEGIFIYFENSTFHQVLLLNNSLFEMRYFSIKEKYRNYEMLEDNETIVFIDLGVTIHFNEEKEDNPYPDEVGIFSKELQEEYRRLYSM